MPVSDRRARRRAGQSCGCEGVELHLPAPSAERRCRRSTASRCRAGAGELLAVVGPSGCGKTTLLELVCGLQAPDRGTVACDRRRC